LAFVLNLDFVYVRIFNHRLDGVQVAIEIDAAQHGFSKTKTLSDVTSYIIIIIILGSTFSLSYLLLL